ncbi:MAG: hypothetical protein R3Y11_02555 [Pseudomonadota bacterium]
MKTIQATKKNKRKRCDYIPNRELAVTPKPQRDTLLIVAVALLLIYVFSQCIISSIAFYFKFPDDYAWTELMINYRGGFIRRGLLGEFLWQIKEVFDLRIAAMFLIYECFIIYYFVLYKKLTQAYDKYLVFFLCASPALFIFLPINSINAFKKDSFILVALLLVFHFISQYMQQKISTCKVYAYTFFLFILGTLIHEILIFYILLPAMLLWQEEYKKGRGAIAFVAIGFVIASTTLFVYLNFGTTEHRFAIAQSWESFLCLPEGVLNDSDSAITWIDKDIEYAWSHMRTGLAFFINTLSTIIAFCLSMIPIGVLYYTYNVRKSIQTYFTIPFYQFFLGIALIFPLSLFFMITDHGRVISFSAIYYVLFFLTMQEVRPQSPHVQYRKLINSMQLNNKLRAKVLLGILLYGCTWRVISVSTDIILQFSMPMRELLRALGLWS